MLHPVIRLFRVLLLVVTLVHQIGADRKSIVVRVGASVSRQLGERGVYEELAWGQLAGLVEWLLGTMSLVLRRVVLCMIHVGVLRWQGVRLVESVVAVQVA